MKRMKECCKAYLNEQLASISEDERQDFIINNLVVEEDEVNE